MVTLAAPIASHVVQSMHVSWIMDDKVATCSGTEVYLFSYVRLRL